MYASAKKNNLGHLVREQWVFSAREVDSLDCLFPVENRARETLLPLILENIRPGSIITSDVWAANGDLSNFGYTHLVVDHFENFVDPISGATTNHVKNMWQK
jgi:hypothetical protein